VLPHCLSAAMPELSSIPPPNKSWRCLIGYFYQVTAGQRIIFIFANDDIEETSGVEGFHAQIMIVRPYHRQGSRIVPRQSSLIFGRRPSSYKMARCGKTASPTGGTIITLFTSGFICPCINQLIRPSFFRRFGVIMALTVADHRLQCPLR